MNPDLRMWARQTLTVCGAELRRNLVTRRGIWIWLLALAPVALMWMHSIVQWKTGRLNCSIPSDTRTLAVVYHYFLLRAAIFFGCVGIFTRLFRAELLERSLHYYFLAPVRREVILAGKFLAGLCTALLLFGASTLLSFSGIYAHHYGAPLDEFLRQREGLHQLAGYLGITAFACLGYGAIFLVMGMLFRNAVFPALGVMLWEWLNFLLPAWLKKFSVVFYLKSLAPVELPIDRMRGPLALLGISTEPAPAWLAVTGLLCFAALALAFAAWQARRMEVNYAGD